MKPETEFLSRTTSVAMLLIGIALTLHGATTNATTETPASSVSPSSATAEGPVARSVFVIPRTPKEGKDPFFPESTRSLPVVTAGKTNPPVIVVVELVLGGISGTSENPLAIINNRTFAPGEVLEINVGSQNKSVRCLAINMEAGTALVEIAGGERRELSLKKPR